jgi:hypothetical protein
VQSEPWLEHDNAMIDPIKSLGIEKGRPFNPDATSRAALEAGARDAHDWLNYFYETGLHPYYEGTHWAVPAQMLFVEEAAKGCTTPDFYPVDARALTARPYKEPLGDLPGSTYLLKSVLTTQQLHRETSAPGALCEWRVRLVRSALRLPETTRTKSPVPLCFA